MTDPDLVAATYLEVAAKHREQIEYARYRIAHWRSGSDHPSLLALVEIDDAMRAVITNAR